MNEVEKLSKFAETQPHVAFTHGLSSKWNYLLRLIDWEESQFDGILESLESVIQSHLIPALTGQPPPLDIVTYAFWGGRFEKAFVDVKVFNPSPQSNCQGPLSSVYCKHKQQKGRQYHQ